MNRIYRPATRTALLIAAILQIVWGIVPTASNLVIQEMPIELYIAVRWTISGLIFLAFLAFTKTPVTAPKRDLLSAGLLGVLGYALGSLGTLYGLKIGGITNFAMMASLSPIVVTVASVIMLGERPQKLFFIALPTSVLGLVLLLMGKHQVSGWTLAVTAGIVILLAYAAEALVFVFSKRLKKSLSTLQYLAVTQLSAAAAMWVCQIGYFHQASAIFEISIRAWMAIFFVSIVACVLCYAVLYWLLNHIEGHRLSLFDGLHTISATAFGYFIFKESITPAMFLGGTLLLSASVLGNWRSSGESKPV